MANPSMSSAAAKAMIVAPHPLAAKAGMEILAQGGNAVEAVIAAAAASGVVYPHMNGLGGDNFWLIFKSAEKKIFALNASGCSGKGITAELYLKKGWREIPARGYAAAITVPGAVSGLWEAYKFSQNELAPPEHGGRSSWKDLLTPAFSWAEDGFPVSAGQARWTNIFLEKLRLKGFPADLQEFCKVFLKDGQAAYSPGEKFRQPDLAKTLQLLMDEGGGAFYGGQIADKITADLAKNSVMGKPLLTEADFADYQAEWVAPLSVPYREFTACNLPPNSQGLASLSILNILNNFDLGPQSFQIAEGSADYYHLLVEAVKLAFADRDKYIADPDFMEITCERLLSKEYGRKLAEKIDMNKAAGPAPLKDSQGDTVWIGATDIFGNAVSFIQSIYHDFGSAVVPKDTGIILHNRGVAFTLDKSAPNCLGPAKRPFHTLNPAMLLQNDRPYLIYGTMGGDGQPQTQAALATRSIDFAMPPAKAIDAPRFLYGRTWGERSEGLFLEGRISKSVIQELVRRGHSVRVVENYSEMMGHAGIIQTNFLQDSFPGAADPRGEGSFLTMP